VQLWMGDPASPFLKIGTHRSFQQWTFGRISTIQTNDNNNNLEAFIKQKISP